MLALEMAFYAYLLEARSSKEHIFCAKRSAVVHTFNISRVRLAPRGNGAVVLPFGTGVSKDVALRGDIIILKSASS